MKPEPRRLTDWGDYVPQEHAGVAIRYIASAGDSSANHGRSSTSVLGS